MTETRTPYGTNLTPDPPRVAYPGSRLELLAEALDTLKAADPKAYREYEHIHGSIDAVLAGLSDPGRLITWLMNRDP